MTERELREILSRNIKRFRGRRSWSQAALAEKTEISTNFLSDIETGKGWVSPLTLVKLAKVLNIEVYELFMPEGKPKDEIKGIVTKITKDISITVGQSLDKIRKAYIS
jgi:transcriptional regulator with XRE-family HTH domain